MAARLWVTGNLDETTSADKVDDALSDARAANLPQEEIDALAAVLNRRKPDQGQFEGVWPEHVLPMRAFLSAATQLRTRMIATEAGLRDRVVGIDYAAASVAWSVYGINLDTAAFSLFAFIESTACALLNGEEPRL